jgi:peptidoglycan DL-endopeptidase CwlO
MRRRRRLVLIVIAAGLCLVVVYVAMTVAHVIGAAAQQAQASDMPCDATISTVSAGPQGPQDAQHLDADQKQIAGRIIALGQQRHISPRGWQVALQAGMTESGLRNLPYGDRTSLGVFQIQDFHEPAPGQWPGPNPARLDLDWEINWFYNQMLAIPGWEQEPPDQAAQDVERSAFPGRYKQAEPVAATLVSTLGQVADPSGCGSNVTTVQGPSGAADAAVKFALAEQGKPYKWGATGPDSYDCSGLVLAAYRQANIVLPRTAADQYNAGAHIPFAQAQPGDLIFWSPEANNPAVIEHVAIYLGNNQVVEAPDTGEQVKVVPVWNMPNSNLIPMATRPGTPPNIT